MIINEGDIISVKEFKSKRLKLICILSINENYITEVYTLKPVYCPAPKSTLNKQSSFSKVKHKIYGSINR